MSMVGTQPLADYCRATARAARHAAEELAVLPSTRADHWLRHSARLMRQRSAELQEANGADVAAAAGAGLTQAQIDRLKLTPGRIEAMACALEEIARLPSPLGEIIESSVRPNGLELHKVRVPLGVIFFMYESRPNVTAEAAALCLKSGNAVILRGGKEAAQSNRTIVELLEEALLEAGLPRQALHLVETPDREAVGHFLKLEEYIALAIPRGGEALIRRVVEEARMPVIKHFTGNCHVYVDRSADLDLAARITVNAKCQRPGVCNAAESLLVHADVAAEFVPQIAAELHARGVEIRGDPRVCELFPQAVPASEEDYSREYLDLIISARVVGSLDEAIAHINRYGSHHTDAIVTASLEAARKFAARVDSSAVMINASTRFHDGGEFGLGGEIGISTDKFHARGPCGLKELTTYKWVAYGQGQIRE